MRKFQLLPVFIISALAVAGNAFAANDQKQTLRDHVSEPRINTGHEAAHTLQQGGTKPAAIEERKKCFSSHFESDDSSAPRERVMRPEFGAGTKAAEDCPEAKPSR